MEQHGMGFVEAVRDLAQQAGLAVPEEESSPGAREEAQRHKQRQLTLTDVLARAADGYRQQLKGSDRAIAYLKGRGLSGEIAARFGLGYAADSWRGLASVFPTTTIRCSRKADWSSHAATSRRPKAAKTPRRPSATTASATGSCFRSVGAGRRHRLRRPHPRQRRAEVPQLARDALFIKGRELYGLFEARRRCASAAMRLSSRATWMSSPWRKAASATPSPP